MTDADQLRTRFADLLKQASERRQPPVTTWNPQRTGEIDIQIDAQGSWLHEGREFRRDALVNLFATILRRDGEDYFLVTPAEKLRIKVADVPFLAVDVDQQGQGRNLDLAFTTNVGDVVVANAEHQIYLRGEKPYLHVRDGLEARITRSVYYRLSDAVVTEDEHLCLYSAGARFVLT